MIDRFTDKFMLEEGFQSNFLNEIMIREKLTQRKFAKLLNVSRRGLRHWLNEERLIPKIIFITLLNKFSYIKTYQKYILKELPRNWVQIKGGKIRSKTKCNLTKKDRIKGFNKAKYSISQRKVIGPKGELMFNNGEELIAEFLLKNNFDYNYETIISLGKNYAVPDFIVSDIIIERCGFGNWTPYWSNLVKKLHRLEKYKKGKVIILTPSKYFEIATKKLHKINNLILLREEDIEVLPSLIRAHGPITTKVVGKAQHGRAADS